MFTQAIFDAIFSRAFQCNVCRAQTRGENRTKIASVKWRRFFSLDIAEISNNLCDITGTKSDMLVYTCDFCARGFEHVQNLCDIAATKIKKHASLHLRFSICAIFIASSSCIRKRDKNRIGKFQKAGVVFDKIFIRVGKSGLL